MIDENKQKDIGVLHRLVDVKKEDITLKFIFDHIRNYGIAASVMVAGFYLHQHGSTINLTQFPGASTVFGISFILLGLTLLAFNLSQAIWALIRLEIPKIPYFIFSSLMFFGAINLVWVLVQQMGYNG